MDARGLGNRGVRMQIKRRYNLGSRKKSGRYLGYRVLWERSVFNSTFCFWDYHIIMTFLPSFLPFHTLTRNFSKQLLWKDCLGDVQRNFSLLSPLGLLFSFSGPYEFQSGFEDVHFFLRQLPYYIKQNK